MNNKFKVGSWYTNPLMFNDSEEGIYDGISGRRIIPTNALYCRIKSVSYPFTNTSVGSFVFDAYITKDLKIVGNVLFTQSNGDYDRLMEEIIINQENTVEIY